MAFDAGLFSFRDISTNPKHAKPTSIFTLITNPKDILAKTRQEPSNRPLNSTHIRLLIFSQYTIINAEIFVDEVLIGKADRMTDDINAPPLYTILWRPGMYSKGVHSIRAVVIVWFWKIFFVISYMGSFIVFWFLKDVKGNMDQTGFEFALDDSLKSFEYFASLLLVNSQIVFVSFVNIRKIFSSGYFIFRI